MKKEFVFAVISAMTIASFSSCKKTPTPDPDTVLIRDARNYWQGNFSPFISQGQDANLRISGARTLDWGQARVANLSKVQAVVVPIIYAHPFYLGANFGGTRLYGINGLSQIVIYKDSTQSYCSEMVTALPDSIYRGLETSRFTGMILVDQWNGQPISRYRYDGRPTGVWRPGVPGKGVAPVKQPEAYLLETCYEIVGYNYPASNPSAGYAWQEDEGCTYSFINETPGTALLDATDYPTTLGVAGAPFSPAAMYPGDGGIVDGGNLTFNFDSLPAIDLSKYFICFTYIPDQGATYSVTLCTDIPVDNNPGALLSTSFSTGHTFIILTKTNGNVSMSQSFGFYPQSRVLSSITFVPSKISDNGVDSHEFDASIVMPNISQLDFQTVEHMAINLANSQQYNLYNYNCTNYALQVFNSIRINDPVNVSDWIGAYTGINFGTTPNGLYESLLAMKTPFPGISNPTISIGPKYAPGSAGPCN